MNDRVAPRSSVRLFDAHAHFFTNDIARYPIDTSKAREGEEQLRERVMRAPGTVEETFGLWDATGVLAGAAVQFNNVYKTDNSYTLDIADRHRDRITAIVILDATIASTPDQLRTFGRTRNVSGVRLVGYRGERGDYPWLDSPAALRTWEAAGELGVAVDLMYRPPDLFEEALPRICALARRFPHVPIIVDHCGFPVWTDAANHGLSPWHLALAELPNIFLKLTTINLQRFRERGESGADFVRHWVSAFGPDRIMWGSDVGNSRAPYAAMVEMAIAATAALGPDERDKILYRNAMNLLDRYADKDKR